MGKAAYAQHVSGEMCVFCSQMLCHALHDHYYNLCWYGAMQRGTMVFYRLEMFEYSVSSLTAPTPWSWPHEYATTSEDHVTICLYTAKKSCSWFAYNTFVCFLHYFLISFLTLWAGVHFPKQQWLLTSVSHSTTFAFILHFPLTFIPIKERFF